MATNEPTPELNEAFSEPGADAVPWTEVVTLLERSEMFWLSTVRRDGRPHVTPIPTVWRGEQLHMCTGSHEQKAVNLANDPRCILTTGTNGLHGGIDVVVEGTAERVTDHDDLVHLAELWKTKLDWDFEVGPDAFRDPDGRHGLVYALVADKVLAFRKGPYSQTRFRLTEPS